MGSVLFSGNKSRVQGEEQQSLTCLNDDTEPTQALPRGQVPMGEKMTVPGSSHTSNNTNNFTELILLWVAVTPPDASLKYREKRQLMALKKLPMEEGGVRCVLLEVKSACKDSRFESSISSRQRGPFCGPWNFQVLCRTAWRKSGRVKSHRVAWFVVPSPKISEYTITFALAKTDSQLLGNLKTSFAEWAVRFKRQRLTPPLPVLLQHKLNLKNVGEQHTKILLSYKQAFLKCNTWLLTVFVYIHAQT